MPVQKKQVTITYKGSLAGDAATLTMRWGYDNWTSPTDAPMTRQDNGSWRAIVILPAATSTLNIAFFNQSGTWDNNRGSDYNMTVSQH